MYYVDEIGNIGITYLSPMEAFMIYALKYKLQGMCDLAKTKERKFTSGMNRRYKLIFSNPVSGMQKDAWVGIKYKFTQNIPANTLDEAQTASQLSGIVSHETQLGIISAAAEALGFGKNFYAMNPDAVRRFVNVAWSDGENFSQKIWKNTDKLAGYLNTDIAQGFARGDSYEKMVRNLRQRFGKVSRKDAYRLIYTEGTYVMAESTMQPFIEDFEEYRISTAADGKVCSICRALAQRTFRIKDR